MLLPLRSLKMFCDFHLIFQGITATLWPVAVKHRSKGPGGAREGAGRKRVVQDPERIAVDLERSDLDAMRALAEKRETSVAALIRRAVSAYLGRSRRE
jgi:hypothetical protein